MGLPIRAYGIGIMSLAMSLITPFLSLSSSGQEVETGVIELRPKVGTLSSRPPVRYAHKVLFIDSLGGRYYLCVQKLRSAELFFMYHDEIFDAGIYLVRLGDEVISRSQLEQVLEEIGYLKLAPRERRSEIAQSLLVNDRLREMVRIYRGFSVGTEKARAKSEKSRFVARTYTFHPSRIPSLLLNDQSHSDDNGNMLPFALLVTRSDQEGHHLYAATEEGFYYQRLSDTTLTGEIPIVVRFPRHFDEGAALARARFIGNRFLPEREFEGYRGGRSVLASGDKRRIEEEIGGKYVEFFDPEYSNAGDSRREDETGNEMKYEPQEAEDESELKGKQAEAAAIVFNQELETILNEIMNTHNAQMDVIESFSDEQISLMPAFSSQKSGKGMAKYLTDKFIGALEVCSEDLEPLRVKIQSTINYIESGYRVRFETDEKPKEKDQS